MCENNHIYCFEYLKKPHGESPCDNILNQSMEEYKKNNYVKKCPNCTIIIEKNTGYNHIACAKCGYQWCQICNKEYKSDHYLSGNCQGFQYFQPKNDNDIKLVIEGKLNPEQLFDSQRLMNINEFNEPELPGGGAHPKVV